MPLSGNIQEDNEVELPGVKLLCVTSGLTFTGKFKQRQMYSILLLGRMASRQVRSMDAISSLDEVEFKVFSQWGEDGIIDWLIERAEIPPSSA